MKKGIVFLLAIFCVLPSFAERKTRIDKYKNCQVKVTWDSNENEPQGNFAERASNLESFKTFSSCFYFLPKKQNLENLPVKPNVPIQVVKAFGTDKLWYVYVAEYESDSFPRIIFQDTFYNASGANKKFTRLQSEYDSYFD